MEQGNLDTSTGAAKGTRGRKGPDGTEETIKVTTIKQGVADLMRLYKKAQAAKDDYNNSAKGLAERSNCNTGILKKLISSSAKDKYEDTRRLVEQQSVLFEAVGEVPGGSETGQAT